MPEQVVAPIATQVIVSGLPETRLPGMPDYTDMVRRRLGSCLVHEGETREWKVGGHQLSLKIEQIEGVDKSESAPLQIDRKQTRILTGRRTERRMPLDNFEADEYGLTEMIRSSFYDAPTYRTLGLPVTKSILIHGVSGVGKTTLVKQVAKAFDCKLIDFSLYELLAYKEEFDNPEFGAYNPLHLEISKAIENAPCLVIVRDLNALQKGQVHNDKVLSILCKEINRIQDNVPVCIVGLAQELRPLPDALQKCDIFHQHLHVPIPTMPQRKAILRSLLSKMTLEPPPRSDNTSLDALDYYATRISLSTSGYVPRDLRLLCRNAIFKSLRRRDNQDIADQLAGLHLDAPSNIKFSRPVSWADFEYALLKSRPSQQQTLLTEPNIVKRDWSELGGYDAIKRRMKQAALLPLLQPDRFAQLGIKPPSGLLLYGPSGCGKTAMVQALVSESMLNVITIRGPEIFSKYLGETEQKIRQLFATAKRIAPCIVFIDEMDAISTRRGWDTRDSSGGVNERVLSTLLNEMDGVEGRQGVLVIGCTNRPDQIDDAILRPGRLDQLIYVGLPDLDDRVQIIEALRKKMAIAPSVNDHKLAERMEYCTGADIEYAFREAGTAALRRNIEAANIQIQDLDMVLDPICERARNRAIECLEVFEKFKQAHSI